MKIEHAGCPGKTKIRRNNLRLDRPGPGRVIIRRREAQRAGWSAENRLAKQQAEDYTGQGKRKCSRVRTDVFSNPGHSLTMPFLNAALGRKAQNIQLALTLKSAGAAS